MNTAAQRRSRPSVPTAADLRWRGWLQTASLRVESAAIAYAPTTDDSGAAIERTRQQLAHLEHSVELYRERCGGDLAKALTARVETLRIPASWLEANVAQLVLSLAAQTEARRWLDEKSPSRTLLRQLAEKSEHIDAARAALRDLRAAEPDFSVEVPRLTSQWLDIALCALEADRKHEYAQPLRSALEPSSTAEGGSYSLAGIGSIQPR